MSAEDMMFYDVLESWSRADCINFAIWCAKKTLPICAQINTDGTFAAIIRDIENCVNSSQQFTAAKKIVDNLDDGGVLFDRDVWTPVAAAYAIFYTAKVASRQNKEPGLIFLVAHWTAIALGGRHRETDLLKEYIANAKLNTVSLFELNKGL